MDPAVKPRDDTDKA
ncbi:MAG TPA: hypothetical protein LFW11_01540 [Rickettsia endosymbiont of Proechinophthirus fluctus]|nr:hypothetical protein [Rickettsia endosymbiont of Proechinophthirus fluctus]